MSFCGALVVWTCDSVAIVRSFSQCHFWNASRVDVANDRCSPAAWSGLTPLQCSLIRLLMMSGAAQARCSRASAPILILPGFTGGLADAPSLAQQQEEDLRFNFLKPLSRFTFASFILNSARQQLSACGRA
jgi:hypothetical protein